MIDAAHRVAFNRTLLAALASPGPALLLALRTTLVAGPRAGIATGAGLAVALGRLADAGGPRSEPFRAR